MKSAGLNIIALETSAKMGAKMVWMPTHSSLNSRANMRKLPGASLEGDGFSSWIRRINWCRKLIRSFHCQAVRYGSGQRPYFAKGNIRFVYAAQKKGIKRLVVTHGLWTNGLVRFTLDELKQLGQMGAFIENCYVGFLPTDFRNDPKPMADAIKYIGAEHCIMSTDLGQYYNPSPAEGMRMFIALLLKYGISAPEIEFMAKKNPAKLLGLD